jgi:RNA polymerase sigma-70 factor (ECF subfamily)
VRPRFPVPATPPTYAELVHLSDDQAMAWLQSGCDDALSILFDRYHWLVFSVALRIVRDPGEAEDVTQNVFFEIFRAVAQFDPAKGNSKSWILQYAYHRAINRKHHLRARHFYVQEKLSNVIPAFPDGAPALGHFNAHELKVLISEGLASLNAPQRQVIQLAGYDGLSMKEIAAMTGESVSNVRHHYYRGLQRLRSLISRSPDVLKENADVSGD